MRSLAKLTRLFPVLLIVLLGCQPNPDEKQSLEFDTDLMEAQRFIADAETRYLNAGARTYGDITSCGEAVEYPLMWYLDRSVGNIRIWNSPDFLIADITLDSGFSFLTTELAVIVRNEMDSTENTYVYPVSHEEGTQEYRYQIPLSDFDTLPESVLLIARIEAWKEPGIKEGKEIMVLAKDPTLDDKRYLIEYFIQQCDALDLCVINCQFGFGFPSVDIAESYTFEEMGLTDWPWGYAHLVRDETLFRLPLKMDTTETGEIVGQVTVMIEDDIAYVYFQMNNGFQMHKSSLYLSPEIPSSGIPCNYNYIREYIDMDGNWLPTATDTYVIENMNEIRAMYGEFFIITYVDFCE
jgi:hypothetical protein